MIKKFGLPYDVDVTYKDSTETEVDADIFSELLLQGNVTLTACMDDGVSMYIGLLFLMKFFIQNLFLRLEKNEASLYAIKLH